MKPPTLTDGIVTLRAHRESDIAGVVEQSNDPESQRWTTVPVDYTREDAIRFVRHNNPGGWLTDAEWAFSIEYAGEYSGTLSLRNLGDGRAELAYGSHPRIRGTGGMERACRLLLTWGFEQQGVRHVHWTAYRGNFASRKLAWKLGFDILPGHLRQSLVQRGQLVDAWVGSLLHTDGRRPGTPWYDAPVFETERIRLRPVLETDLPAALEALSDGEVARWIGSIPHPFKPEHFLEWQLHGAEEMAQGQAVRWAITDIDSDQLIGVINIFEIDRATASGEVGYWIHPGRSGQGLMSQALGLVIDHGTGDSLGLSRLMAHVAHGNTASNNLLQRHGFTQVGSLSHAVVTGTGRRDAAIFELTDSHSLDLHVT